MGGAAAGQIILVATLPIVSRIYNPADFGILAIFGALLGLLSSISSLRYEAGIPLSDKSSDAINLWAGGIAVSALLAALVVLSALLIVPYVESFYLPPGYILILGFGVLMSGANINFLHYALFEKKYGAIAKARIAQSIMAAFIRIVVGLVYSGPLGLVLGAVLATGGGVYTLWKKVSVKDRLGDVKVNDIKRVLYQNRKLPIFSAPTSLLNAASLHLPVLALSVIFSTKEVGFFALAMSVGSAPLSLLGQAIKQVFLSVAGEAKKKNNLGKTTENYAIALAAVSIVPAFTLIPIIPYAAEKVFGAGWYEAGVVLVLLVPWMVSQFVTSPLSSTVIAAGNQKGGFFSQIIFLLVRVLSVAVGYYWGGFERTILLLSLASCLCYLGYSIWVFYITRANTVKIVIFWGAMIAAGSFVFVMEKTLIELFWFGNEAWLSFIILSTSFLFFCCGLVFGKRVIDQ